MPKPADKPHPPQSQKPGNQPEPPITEPPPEEIIEPPPEEIVDPPPVGNVIWEDHFDGPSGSKPDAAKWEVVTTPGADWDDWCRIKPENTFLDGNGNLVLRSKPDSAGANGIPFSGAIVATYGYDTGYPAGRILAQWDLPFRYECRWRMPPIDGAHVSAGWVQQLDNPKSEHIFELDCGESHSTDPNHAGFYQHDWINGVEQNAKGISIPVASNWRENFHIVACEVRSDRVDYFFDNAKVATYYGVSGKYGAVLHNPISRHSWQNGGAMPDPNEPGPWDMLVDYVRVSKL